jgi:hypothetical protein
MTESEAVEFVFAGAVAGQPVSASQGVPFTRFIEFNNEVQSYLQGSDNKTVLHDVNVQVHEGSYLLRVFLPIGLLPSLIADTIKLSTSTTLTDIDENRARVVLRWQERAKMEPTLTYTVRSPSGTFSPVMISKDSNLLRHEKIVWVDVERYVIGEITDWGGAQNPNVHIRLRNSRETIIVDATADQIREQRDNLVFHKAIVHLRAKQNVQVLQRAAGKTSSNDAGHQAGRRFRQIAFRRSRSARFRYKPGHATILTRRCRCQSSED